MLLAKSTCMFWVTNGLEKQNAECPAFGYQAAVEEGIVVGGGCTLLRLASKVDAIKDTLDNDEEKVNFYVHIWSVSYD